MHLNLDPPRPWEGEGVCYLPLPPPPRAAALLPSHCPSLQPPSYKFHSRLHQRSSAHGVHGTRVRSGSFIKGKTGAKGAGKTVVFDMILMEDISEAAVMDNIEA